MFALLTLAVQRAHASCANCIEVDTYDDSFTVCGDAINLRCAINYANGSPGTFIRFNPGIVTVTVQSPLPAITGAGTWIDGSDSNGTYVGPILTGSSWSGAAGSALTINASNVTISNIKIVNIPPGGTDISLVGGKNNEISYDYLGILPGATQCGVQPQTAVGVEVLNDVAGSAGKNNGTAYIFSNTISCHGGSGVEVVNSNYVHVGANRDSSATPGNYIGTAPDGTHAAGNGYAGVRVAVNSDQVSIRSNRIAYNGNAGVTADGTNIEVLYNTLSANYWGLAIGSTGSSQLIVGNNIGTTADGLHPLPNSHEGMLFYGGSGYFVTDNLVAHNGGTGVAVTGNSTHAYMQNNNIYGNGGLPIDLGNNGHTPNGLFPPGPNDWLWYPVVTSFSGNLVTGTTCPNCSVWVFKAIGNPAAPEGGGIFKTNVTANSSGVWVVDLTGTGLTRLDVTFTASDANGNTSEMSPRPQLLLPLVRR